MTGVEYRLGHNDHLVVEDFLSQAPEGVAGIIIDAKYVSRHKAAIEAAGEAGVAVHVEPLTERLVAEGYSSGGLDYGEEVIDPAVDLSDTASQDRLVKEVLGVQREVATAVTPPHFFVEDDDALELDLDLLRCTTQLAADSPIRPILAAKRTYLDQAGFPAEVARRYRRQGVRTVDLRLSPLGDKAEGPAKIGSVLRILQGLRDGGLEVVMGSQGTIGETVMAMGLASGFSVGIGYREKYDFKATIGRQRRRSESDGGGSGGPIAGVYLPELATTVRRSTAEALYDDPGVRTRLMCQIGACRDRIDRPAHKPRPHYLHARASDVAEILSRPAQWRPMLQRDRLVRAIDAREFVSKYLPEDASKMKDRTLRTLIDVLDQSMEAAA